MLVACPPSTDPAAVRTSPIEARMPPEPLDALSQRLGRVRRRMRERGYRETAVLPREFVLQGRGIVVPLELTSGLCSTYVSLAAGGVRRLQMLLYDENGHEIASSRQDGEGLVHACPIATQADHSPLHTLAHYLVIRSRSGSGAVVFSKFESELGEGDGFDGLFDGIRRPIVPLDETEKQLTQARSLLRSRGLSPVENMHLVTLAESEGTRRSYELTSERCYFVVARAGEGVRDLDVYVFDEDGAEVERELDSRDSANLPFCPTEDGRHTIEVRIFEGSGAVGLMLMDGPPSSARSAPLPSSAVSRGTARPGSLRERSKQSTASKPLRGTPLVGLHKLTEAMQGRGYVRPTFVAREVRLDPGETRRHQVLTGEHCVVVMAAADDATADLDLYLFDGQAQSIDSDAGIDSTARVVACAEEAEVLDLAVKLYGRPAAYSVVMLFAPSELQGVQSIRLDLADALFRDRGYVTTVEAVRDMEVGERFVQDFILAAGSCLAVAAAGDRGVEDVDITLRGEDGRVLASASGPEAWGAVGKCASPNEPSRMLSAEVLIYRGAGRVAIRHLENPG